MSSHGSSNRIGRRAMASRRVSQGVTLSNAECKTLGIILIACDNDSTDALKRFQGPGKSVTDTSDDQSDRIGKRDMRASRRV